MAMRAMYGKTSRRIFAALVVTLFVTKASATQVRPLNIEEMTERATTIFAGRCLQVRVETDHTLGNDVTVATFRVERSIKGNAGNTITVRMPWANVASFPAGVPSFARGDDVVLFLYGESASGMRAPVGLGQGRFRIVTDKQGRRIAINDVGNRNLMHGVSAGTRQRLDGVPGLSLEGSLSPETLMDAVDGLLRAHQ
jgi:hypothetical protein